MIDLAEASDPRLLRLISAHPKVVSVRDGGGLGVRFFQGSWSRRIGIGEPDLEVSGLAELMDNNPLVCADEASVPDPLSTLALIALGPLGLAGLIEEGPVVQTNAPAAGAPLLRFLSKVQVPAPIVSVDESKDLSGVYAATAIATMRTPDRIEDIDDVFEEAYGRCFFVKRNEISEWDVSLVSETSHAVFRMRIARDEPNSLLTVRAMADRDGKCGAAQVVHMMNVMAGFEETLGLWK